MTNTKTTKSNKQTGNKAVQEELIKSCIIDVKHVETAVETVQQPEKSKQQIAFEKQLAALIAVGFSQADAEKALAAIKPVARQAAEEMPAARWQLAKALSTWCLTPVTEKHTEESTFFTLEADCTEISRDFDQIKADVKQFLQKSTFANACKNGKKVLLKDVSFNKADAAEFAADYIANKFMLLVSFVQADAKAHFDKLKADAPADNKVGA